MRGIRFRVGLSAALAMFCSSITWTTPTRAQTASGFSLNRFDPSERGSNWFWAESLDLRGHNRFAIGLVGDWAHKPLVAYDENGDEIASLVENQVHGHLGASWILLDRIRLGVSAPVLLYQNGSNVDSGTDTIEAPSGAAFGDVRLGGDVRLFGEYGEAITGAIGAHVHVPSGNRDSYTSDGAARLVPRASLAGDIGVFTYALKTGVNFRFQGDDFAGQAFGHEWTWGGAAGLKLLDKRLTIGPELWASTVLSDGGDGFFKQGSTPFEGIFGAHYFVHDDWQIGAGFGPGFTQGLGSPEFRTLISVDWFPTPKPAVVEPPKDRDGDGILDEVDACPTEPGIESDDPQKHGCPLPPDTDGDGIIDEEDACAEEPGEPNPDPEKNGCPPPKDTDGDGILDEVDACPTEPGVADEDEPDKHGCPIRDTDGDEIFDDVDACIETVGTPSRDPAMHGCPKAKIEGKQVKILERIEFDTGKATLREESNGVLSAVKNVLEEHPEIEKLSIEGHTDNRGSKWLNTKLSRERAKAVLTWLVEQGIDPSRLSSRGFGPDKPVDSNDTDEGRQNNRRVEFHIQKMRETEREKNEGAGQ